jgi:dTDP-4-amino-4,6-dideoxygalactose transaminase
MSIWKVQLFETNFDDGECAAAEDVVRSGWLTMGERVAEFERKFGEMLQAPGTCIATANCTASLHMAMLALDIAQGDEVVIPALTFVADANAVRMTGARPVLADCASLDDWNMSAATIERALTKRTKAVMILHFAGYPCDVAPIVALCRKRGLPLVEDVAHAPGATIDGQACGTFGDISCFSFFSNKNLSVGEGGMVVAKDRRLYERLRGLRSHGMTTLTLDRHEGRAVTYDVLAPGLNYRMDEIRAAIGLVQLAKLANGNKRRADLTARYRSRLAGVPVRIPFTSQPAGAHSAYHILPLLLPEGRDRLEVIEKLKRNGVQSSIHYPPFWGFTGYQGMFDPKDTPVVAEIVGRELTLPLYPSMRDEQVDYVTDALREALA